MKLPVSRYLAFVLAVLLGWSFLPRQPGKAALAPSPILDAALSLLEADNPFLLRYQTQSGSQVSAPFELGVPYFFGGERYDLILRVRQPWQNSQYYKTNKYYVYGFDCSGYTKWVLKKAGFPEHPSISSMFQNKYRHRQHIQDFSAHSLADIHLYAQIGDLYMIRRLNTYHIMLYIGTLRGYGFDENNTEPGLASYLDYPLMAHSSENPFYYQRYQAWVAQHIKQTPVTLPDGGVMVSLIGVPQEAAPHSAVIPGDAGKLASYFLVDGYALTLYDPGKALSTQWFRWTK